MGHDHSHGAHAGHAHSHASHSPGAGERNERRLLLAALLTTVTLVAEAAGGIISGSLALLADAGHMLTDAAALILAWLAVRFARRPADWKRTYGFERFEVLAAFSNGLALFFIWLFSDWLGRAYDEWWLPLLGFFLLPGTTLAYAVMYVSGPSGVEGIEWFSKRKRPSIVVVKLGSRLSRATVAAQS